jgi:hypothetical protein
MTSLRDRIAIIIIDDQDQKVSASSTADSIFALPEIVNAQLVVSVLKDLLANRRQECCSLTKRLKRAESLISKIEERTQLGASGPVPL